jgi:hypothetical protein
MDMMSLVAHFNFCFHMPAERQNNDGQRDKWIQ